LLLRHRATPPTHIEPGEATLPPDRGRPLLESEREREERESREEEEGERDASELDSHGLRKKAGSPRSFRPALGGKGRGR
jgi:hypothetical protein